MAIVEKAVGAYVWASLLLRFVGIPLLILYLLIRFVKWAWTND